ncbi:MAG: HD domain-containing phosphohydrolase [Thermodesulfobacteriota bacterium]
MQQSSAPIWIIDDVGGPAAGLKPALERLGYASVSIGRERLDAGSPFSRSPDLIFLAAKAAAPLWQRTVFRIFEMWPDCPVVALFDEDVLPADVRLAFRSGVFDCLLLPLTAEEELRPLIHRALEAAQQRRKAWTGRPYREAGDGESDRVAVHLKERLLAAEQELADERNKRRYAEYSAQEHRKAWSIIFDNTHDAVIHLDRKGFVVNTNATIFDVFGLLPEEVMGRDLGSYEFLGFDYRQALELYKAACPNIAFPVFELEAFRRDGVRIHIESRAKPVIQQNTVEGVINIVRDVTPQKRLENTKNATILGLAKLAESRDDSTGRHLERVREYVKILTQALARLPRYSGYITPAYIKDIYLSSILHDIGKVSVPDAILLKPGPLTPDEFAVIKQHALVGGNALAAVDAELQEQSFLTLGKEIAYHHHEAWDGTGYPHGLAGEQIPLSARIVALADVYDALTTRRVYKLAFPHPKAASIILDERGKKFDPDIVDVFAAYMDEFDKVRRKIEDESSSSAPLPGTLLYRHV